MSQIAEPTITWHDTTHTHTLDGRNWRNRFWKEERETTNNNNIDRTLFNAHNTPINSNYNYHDPHLLLGVKSPPLSVGTSLVVVVVGLRLSFRILTPTLCSSFVIKTTPIRSSIWKWAIATTIGPICATWMDENQFISIAIVSSFIFELGPIDSIEAPLAVRNRCLWQPAHPRAVVCVCVKGASGPTGAVWATPASNLHNKEHNKERWWWLCFHLLLCPIHIILIVPIGVELICSTAKPLNSPLMRPAEGGGSSVVGPL